MCRERLGVVRRQRGVVRCEVALLGASADAAPPDTSGVEVTGEVRREDVDRRKRKRAIDVEALPELKVKVEVKEEPPWN